MTWLAQVVVTLKDGVLDPQGKAVRGGLNALGYEALDVRIGKWIEVRLAAPDEGAASDAIAGMCERLLANPVIESWRVAAIRPAPAEEGRSEETRRAAAR